MNPAASATPQVIKTMTLNWTDDENIVVEALFGVNTTGTPQANTLALQIVVGANTYSIPLTTLANARASVAGPYYAYARFQVVSRAADTVNVQLGGGNTADPNTSVNVYSFSVYAVSGNPQGGT